MADILEQLAAAMNYGPRPVSPGAKAIMDALMRRQLSRNTPLQGGDIDRLQSDGVGRGPMMPQEAPMAMRSPYEHGAPARPVGRVGEYEYDNLTVPRDGGPFGNPSPRLSDMPSPGMMPATPRTEGMADPLILDRVERGMAMQGEDYGTDGFYAQRGMNAMQEHGPGFMDYPSQRATMAIGAGTDPQATQDYYNSLTPGMRQQFMNMKLDDPMGQSPSPDQMRERFPPGYEPLDRNKMRDALRGRYRENDEYLDEDGEPLHPDFMRESRFDDARAFQTTQAGPIDVENFDSGDDSVLERGIAGEEMNVRAAMSRLQNIDALLQENPDLVDSLTWTGDMRRRALALRDKTGFDMLALDDNDKEYLSDATVFRQNILRNVNRTIQEITGAAMGEQEAARIRAEVPDVNASPTVFRAQLAAAMDMLRMDAARLQVWRNRGGEGEPNAINDQEVRQTLQSRGADLYRQALGSGMAPDEARLAAQRALAQEFGL